MTDYLVVSKGDVAISQILSISILSLGFMVITFFVFIQFTVIALLLWFLFTVISFIIVFKSRSRNVHYENGKIYLSDILHKEIYEISNFKGISRNVFSGYSIKFSDNKEYFFMISSKDRVSLFFKADPDFYAKELTNQLKNKLNYHLSNQ